jgi:hypothetical protein
LTVPGRRNIFASNVELLLSTDEFRARAQGSCVAFSCFHRSCRSLLSAIPIVSVSRIPIHTSDHIGAHGPTIPAQLVLSPTWPDHWGKYLLGTGLLIDERKRPVHTVLWWSFNAPYGTTFQSRKEISILPRPGLCPRLSRGVSSFLDAEIVVVVLETFVPVVIVPTNTGFCGSI